MSYTPYVWVDGTAGGTPITAARLNAIEQGLSAASSQATTSQTSWFIPTAAPYNALGDGSTIDRAAIQAAINDAHAAYVATGAIQRVYFPGKTFLLDAVNYTKVDGSVYGAVSLMLLDGVELAGTGTLKVRNGAYGNGALYAIVRTSSSGATNVAITGLTFDGNTANNVASQQCSNIVIEAAANVRVTNTRHLAANGNAIMVRGAGVSARNIEICDNTVLAASMIGIQCSHFDGLIIRGNYIANTTNNCIDIYGENGTTTVDSINFTIANNVLKNGLVGIFPETVAQGVVTGNMISNCTSTGVHVNRINGQPNSINVAANTVTGTPYGFYVTGDTGGVTFRNNTVTGATSACVQLGGGGGNVSYVYILDNTFDTATLNSVPLVSVGGNQAAFNRHRGTITKNTDRTKDTVTNATTSVGNNYSPANAA